MIWKSSFLNYKLTCRWVARIRVRAHRRILRVHVYAPPKKKAQGEEEPDVQWTSSPAWWLPVPPADSFDPFTVHELSVMKGGM